MRIKEVFESQPRSHTIEWLADNLHCKRANIYNIFSRSTLDTHLLMHISKVLQHDFFRDLTIEYNNSLGITTSPAKLIYDEIMDSVSDVLKNRLDGVNITPKNPSH